MREAIAFRRNILGNGIVSPLRRLANSDFLSAEGAPLIRSCIAQIIGTMPGDMPWRPNFGTNLQRYRQRNAVPSLGQDIAAEIVTAIQTWEPRVEVSACEVDLQSAEPGAFGPKNMIVVRLTWVVLTGSNDPDNNVLIGPEIQEVIV